MGAARSDDVEAVRSLTDQARYDLLAFRAAPLAEAEQARRAGQLTRFLGLIPIKYARGVSNGVVTVPIEIQEAIIFRDGAANAFGDLQSYLARSDAASTRSVQQALDRLQTLLTDTDRGTEIANPQTIKKTATGALNQLDKTFPDAWKGDNAQADFDVIATLLQKVGASVAAGDYRRAESSRLEAYATFELGPGQHLRGLAPSLFQRVEGLFWYGADGHDGLAQLVRRSGTAADTATTLTALDLALKESAEAVGEGSLATNGDREHRHHHLPRGSRSRSHPDRLDGQHGRPQPPLPPATPRRSPARVRKRRDLGDGANPTAIASPVTANGSKPSFPSSRSGSCS